MKKMAFMLTWECSFPTVVQWNPCKLRPFNPHMLALQLMVMALSLVGRIQMRKIFLVCKGI